MRAITKDKDMLITSMPASKRNFGLLCQMGIIFLSKDYYRWNLRLTDRTK